MQPRIRLFSIVLVVLGVSRVSQAQDPPPPPSLKTVAVPEPYGLSQFVADRGAAIALGKALFWDMQVGSDGVMACASCHFHAGADSRSKNQVSPGLLARDAYGESAPDFSFAVGPNAQLSAALFPLRVLANPRDRASPALRDTNDVVSSQGVFAATFLGIVPGRAEERATMVPDPDGFRVGGVNVRRVEPRHTPSVINAAFNHRNFWDGRAQNEFNGVNEWGARDRNAHLFRAATPNQLQKVSVLLTNSSLASQAVAPPVSRFEMSADGRTFHDLADKLSRRNGHRLPGLRPLARQLVHPQDSVLGGLSRWPDRGLSEQSYEKMIKRAFRKEWWHAHQVIRIETDGSERVAHPGECRSGGEELTLLEYNFSLFFGLAIQLYESTLISDDTPYDRYREDPAAHPLSAEALEGLGIFLRQVRSPDGKAAGRCINCHAGPELTDASVANIAAAGETRNREGQDLDRGFNNIGVRPTLDDLGVGGTDIFGNPLSVTRLRPKSTRFQAVDGTFKAPSLRNVELTAPYFHNGGYLTLESVVDFYSRGGDLAPLTAVDGTAIAPLSVPEMTEPEKRAVVSFLRTLTDERVRQRRAPFDHPQLFVPDGHPGNESTVARDASKPGAAADALREIAPVGRSGGAPLPGFLVRP
jgi:cytochrome c peroxidase